MKCSQCAFDNKPGKKFCVECGTKLALKCPECDSEIEETEKFCGECGPNLTDPQEPTVTELSFDEKIDQIQR